MKNYIEILSGLSEGDEVYVDESSQSTVAMFQQGGMPGGMGGGMQGGAPGGGPGGSGSQKSNRGNQGGGRP